MNRREFSKKLLSTVISYALFDSLFAFNAFSKTVLPVTDHWAIKLYEYCSDLKKNAITPVEWQNLVENLYQEIELKDVLRSIHFDNLIKGFQYPDLGVNTYA